MKLPTISTILLLPLVAVAQSSSSTTTLTSTATMTRTITVSKVVASVTSTYPAHNSTIAGPTAVIGTGASTTVGLSATTSAKATSTVPSNFMGAASSLNSMYAGSAGIVVMIAAAFL